MDYDTWKTTPPEYVKCDDCGVVIDERIAKKVADRTTCPACHELYDPRIP